MLRRRRLLVVAGLMPLALSGRDAAGQEENPQALFNEGVDLFFAAKPVESCRAFDRLVKLAPRSEPQLWQRGLALYYAERYADGRKQFESHRGVNPADVENAAWHFFCVAREKNAAEARKSLLPVGDDARVPMKEILGLCAGTTTPAAVIAAAEAGPEAARRNQLCFAHLYLGLYAEATGDAAKAREHMLLAAGPFAMNHYMGKVAQVHATLRGWKPAAAE